MIQSKNKSLLELDLNNEEASVRFGQKLAGLLLPPLVLTFSGDLGSGKTTLIRAMLRQLGVDSAIKSPTFSLVESYDCQNRITHHFDLYRIAHPEELEYLGFREYFSNQSICCIEWPENAGIQLSQVDLCFKLSVKGVGRHLQAIAKSRAGQTILTSLAGEL
jgi:tRNA threonylcarbamoyladenosine biosynthesis protein TsaE